MHPDMQYEERISELESALREIHFHVTKDGMYSTVEVISLIGKIKQQCEKALPSLKGNNR